MGVQIPKPKSFGEYFDEFDDDGQEGISSEELKRMQPEKAARLLKFSVKESPENVVIISMILAEDEIQDELIFSFISEIDDISAAAIIIEVLGLRDIHKASRVINLYKSRENLASASKAANLLLKFSDKGLVGMIIDVISRKDPEYAGFIRKNLRS